MSCWSVEAQGGTRRSLKTPDYEDLNPSARARMVQNGKETIGRGARVRSSESAQLTPGHSVLRESHLGREIEKGV